MYINVASGTRFEMNVRQGRTKSPQTPKIEIKKKQFFLDMISQVLCDLPSNRNQPLKSADD
jgi:hypothetical protein